MAEHPESSDETADAPAATEGTDDGGSGIEAGERPADETGTTPGEAVQDRSTEALRAEVEAILDGLAGCRPRRLRRGPARLGWPAGVVLARGRLPVRERRGVGRVVG